MNIESEFMKRMKLGILTRKPYISQRQIESNVNRKSCILHRHKFHLYHLSLHQALHGICESYWILSIGSSDSKQFIFWWCYLLIRQYLLITGILICITSFWTAKNPYWLWQIEHQRRFWMYDAIQVTKLLVLTLSDV